MEWPEKRERKIRKRRNHMEKSTSNNSNSNSTRMMTTRITSPMKKKSFPMLSILESSCLKRKICSSLRGKGCWLICLEIGSTNKLSMVILSTSTWGQASGHWNILAMNITPVGCEKKGGKETHKSKSFNRTKDLAMSTPICLLLLLSSPLKKSVDPLMKLEMEKKKKKFEEQKKK